MSRLQFNQIYPHQAMPVLAKDFEAAVPKRAGFFCHPFKSAAQRGVYAFSPMDFSFKLSDSRLHIRVPREDGSQHILTVERNQISNNNFVLLSDIAPKQSAECLSAYRPEDPQLTGS